MAYKSADDAEVMSAISAYSSVQGGATASPIASPTTGSQPMIASGSREVSRSFYDEDSTSPNVTRIASGYGSDAYSSNSVEIPQTYADSEGVSWTEADETSPSPQQGSKASPETPSIAPSASNKNETKKSSPVLASSAGVGSDPSVTSSPSPSPMRAKTQRNWSADFYSIQSNLSKSSAPSQNSTQLDSNESLIAITSAFAPLHAVAVGTKIIEEQFVSDKTKRAFQPVNVGGIAGGEKFIHEGIFYKFALDEHKLYGNSIENAMKTAGHEMKGLTALLDWELKTVGLHTVKFPLMVLIDHRGFRLIAMSILPLKKDTLYYGSDDGAKTMKQPDENRPSTKRLHDLIGTWAGYLNLCPHEIICANGQKVSIRTPFDLEGHVGVDGNLYCCDFARMFPPAGKEPKFAGGFLYRLLRPEFVKKYPAPLCSDGYISTVVDGKNHNTVLEEATNNLLTDIIPKFGHWISTNPLGGKLPTRLLMLLVHQNGINYRYLRILAHFVTDPSLQRRILTEIVARTVKNVLRACFRQMSTSDPEAYKRQVAFFFTLIFGCDEKSADFWEKRLPLEVDRRYAAPSVALLPIKKPDNKTRRSDRNRTEERDSAPEPPRTAIRRSDVDLLPLFARMCELLNIQFSESARNKIFTFANQREIYSSIPAELRILPEEVLDIRPNVKRMFLTSYQEAINLKKRAEIVDDVEEREALLRYSSLCYLECLEVHTHNEFALHNLSRIAEELAVLHSTDPDEEKIFDFIQKRCRTLAVEKNSHLQSYNSDIYQYSDLYQARSGVIVTKSLAEPRWCEHNHLKRLLLASEEIASMADAPREDVCGYYEELFEEFAEPLVNAELQIRRRIAFNVWKLLERAFQNRVRARDVEEFFKVHQDVLYSREYWMKLTAYIL